MRAHIISILVLGTLVAIPFVFFTQGGTLTCTESKRVKAILSLNYRSAVIELEDGEKTTVNQATLKPGDMYCTKMEWKK